MTYTAQADLAEDGAFRAAVQVALAKKALAVSGEAQGAQRQSVWDKRQAFAVQVLTEPNKHLHRAVLAVVANSVVTTLDDTAIDNELTAIWDSLAGVRGAEKV